MSNEAPQEKTLFKKVLWHPLIRLPIKYFFRGAFCTLIVWWPLGIALHVVVYLSDYLFGTYLQEDFLNPNFYGRDKMAREIYLIIGLGYGLGAGLIGICLSTFSESFAKYIDDKIFNYH